MFYLLVFNKRDKTLDGLTTVHVNPTYVVEMPSDASVFDLANEFAEFKSTDESPWKITGIGEITLRPVYAAPQPMFITFSMGQKEEFMGHTFVSMTN